MKPENHVDGLDPMAQERQMNGRPRLGSGFFRKCRVWMWLVLIALGSPAFAIQTDIHLFMATDNSPDACYWSIENDSINQLFSTNGMFVWECGLPIENPYRLHLFTSMDLKPDSTYRSTVTAGSGTVCDAMLMIWPSVDCYDLYVNGKKNNNSYPNWRDGYFMGIGSARNSISCEFYITYNTNTTPVALWCAKDPTGWPSCVHPQKGQYPLLDDGMSAAIATITNNVYLGTNYPVTFALVDTNVNPTGSYLINYTNHITTNIVITCTNLVCITNITTVTNRIYLTNGVVLVAGTNDGSVEVVANTADPDPCLVTNFWFVIGPCSSCGTGQNCDNPQPRNKCVDLKFSLGPSRYGANNAFLQVKSEMPDPSLGTPQSIQCNFIRPELQIITNSLGWLRQVRSLDRVIDITTNTSTGYLVNFYHAGDVLGFSPADGLYYFTNSPFRTIFVQLVNGSTNHLQVINSSDPAPADYIWGTNGWTLVTGNGLRNDSLITTTNGSTYTRAQTIQNARGGVDYQSTETWQIFPYGQRLMQKTTGSGSAAQTETYAYTASGMVQQVNHSDGSWDIYTYDSMDRQIGHYSPFLNSAPTTNSALCRYTASTYDDSVVNGSGDCGNLETYTPRQVVNYVQGNEVSRSYTVVKMGERDEIQCVNPGAAWNAAGNLVTATYVFTDAVNLGQPSKIIRPDGTLQLFAYDTDVTAPLPNANSSYDKTTVWTGAPDYNMDAVVDGTKDETWTDILQRQVLHRVADVASQVVIEQETYYYDALGHLTNTVYLNRTSSRQTYDCCNLLSSTAPDGTVTSYGYDALKRQVTTTVNGVTTSNILDANGSVLGTVRFGMDGSAITNSLSAYDNSGRLTGSTDALGHTTSYTNYFDGTGQLIKVTTYPDLSTRIETYAKDGSLLKTTGTAGNSVRYDYGVESDGGVQRAYTKTIPLDASGNDTSEWTKTYTDGAGRAYKTVYADNNSSQSFYNSYGQLVQQVDPDGVTALYQYNAKGEVQYTAADLNTNGVIDFNGTDRITQTISDVITNGYNLYVRRTRTFVWTINNSSVSKLVSTTETSVDGLQSWNITWNNGVGLTNYSQTAYDPLNGYMFVTSVAPDGSYTLSTSQYGQLISVTSYDSIGNQLSAIGYSYDAHGRQSMTTDARNGSSASFYNNADQVVSTMTPSPDGVQNGQVTTNILDNMGRVIQTILPDGTSVTNLYASTGQATNTFGSRTYATGNSFDYAGRQKTLTTWTNFATKAGAAVTTWNYDGYRGFLTNKAYADGKGPSYTYTPAGRLQTRTWARGTNTTYAYNPAGDLSGVSYSDATPGMSSGFNRLGRQVAVTNGATVCVQNYNDAGELLSESYTGGPLNGISVTNGYDSLLRRTKLVVLQANNPIAQQSFGYDAASRLATVGDGVNTAAYTYLANSPLVGQIVFANNGAVRMTTTKTYDYLNRLTGISSFGGASSASPISSFNYQYNSANQRTLVTNADNSYWNYQYDILGHVSSGKRYWADGTPVAGQQFEYGYDTIGNRLLTKAGGDANGANLRQAAYTANNLNQYTSRDVPGYMTVLGSANSNATVTVNLQRAYRYGSYFSDELSVNNASAALWLSLTNLAVLNNGTNADIVATNTGNVLIGQTPQTFLYDADGNLVSDGLWTNVWNADNRLVYVESLPTVSAAARVHEDWSYLPDGRWNQRIVSTWNTNTLNYQPSTTNHFVWDGQVLLAVLDQTNGLVMSFMRGLAINFKTNGTHFAAFDGNGNVSALVNAVDGTVSATYEYDPFGQTLRITGAVGKLNPIRFGTQYADDITGDLKYLYRDYNPNAGRWKSRDPIGFSGGLNLYAFVGNAPSTRNDFLGMKIEAANCALDDYLSGLKFVLGTDYTRKYDGDNSIYQGFTATRTGEGEAVIIQQMMRSSYLFKVKGDNRKQVQENIGKQVAFRLKVIVYARGLHTGWANGNLAPAPNYDADPSAWEAWYIKNNVATTKLMCEKSTLLAFWGAIGGERNEMYRPTEGILIPGDWYQLYNTAFDKDKGWQEGYEGENTIVLGLNGTGDPILWGKMIDDEGNPLNIEQSLSKWVHDITVDWPTESHAQGLGNPQPKPIIRSPKNGLE